MSEVGEESRTAVRCPSCGFMNQAGIDFCGSCGNKLSGRPPPLSLKKIRSSRKVRIAAVTVVLVIVIVATLRIYRSPDYSWNSSIRDSDRDGWPDAKDAWPEDPWSWTQMQIHRWVT